MRAVELTEQILTDHLEPVCLKKEFLMEAQIFGLNVILYLLYPWADRAVC